MEMPATSNGISKKDRKRMESYIFKHVNDLSEEQKKGLFQEVFLLAPSSLTDSEVSGERSLALDTSLLTNEIMAFIVKAIQDIVTH